MVRQLNYMLTLLLIAGTAAVIIRLTIPDPASLFMLCWGASAALFRRQIQPMRAAISSTRRVPARRRDLNPATSRGFGLDSPSHALDNHTSGMLARSVRESRPAFFPPEPVLRLPFTVARTVSGLTSSGPRPNIHGPYGSRSRRSVSISVDRVGVERHGARVRRLRRRVAQLGRAVAALGDLDRRVDRQHGRRARRSTAAPPARPGGRRRRRRCGAPARRRGRSTRRPPSRRAPRRASSPCAAASSSTAAARCAPRSLLTQPHRTACDSAARSTPCWFLMPASPMPGRAQARVPALDVADRQPSQRQPGDLVLLDATARGSAGRAPTTAPTCRGSARPTRRARRSPSGRPARPCRARRSSSAARRCASRLPPCTVRDSCVGRPRASVPVKTRTSHTPGRFSRIVAMRSDATPRVSQMSRDASLGTTTSTSRRPAEPIASRSTRYAGLISPGRSPAAGSRWCLRRSCGSWRRGASARRGTRGCSRSRRGSGSPPR